MPIATGDLLAELLVAEPDPELALELLVLVLVELLLELPHPASNAAIAATAATIQALRLDLVIWTFSSQRSLRRLAD